MSKKSVKETIRAKGLNIKIYTEDFQNEYISLTDIARYKSDEPFIVINNWMRGKDTLEFLGLWEKLHNCPHNAYRLINKRKDLIVPIKTFLFCF